MDKCELRSHYLQKRKEIPDEKASKIPAYRTGRDENIQSNFELFLPQEIRTIHIYMPIVNTAEIDTWPIIRFLWSKNIQVVVPKVGSKSLPCLPNRQGTGLASMMSSWKLTPETKLAVNAWKVPEPVDAEPADNESIDMVVLPLLICDKRGNRVGYGKGYYDLFLASIKRKVMKVGLSYFPPVEEISDVDAWDIPLDYCITPEEVIRF